MAAGGSPEQLEKELLRAVRVTDMSPEAFPREVAELLAQVAAEWLREPTSLAIPRLLVEGLFRQRLWNTPGADANTVNKAMRTVRAQALPARFKKAAAQLEKKSATKDTKTTRRTTTPTRKPRSNNAPRGGGQSGRCPDQLWATLTEDQRTAWVAGRRKKR